MAIFEVETDLIIYTRVKVTVEADSKDDAISTTADLMPANHTPERSKLWKAQVDLKPPRGVKCQVVKACHFEQASGNEKARKVSP